MLLMLSWFWIAQVTAPVDAPWEVTVAAEDEPGQRLTLEGEVVHAGTGEPVPGASVSLFHTDQQGYYSAGGQDRSRPKLSGAMRTNPDGRFRFHSIRPGHYPGADIPAHIHVKVEAEGYNARSFEIVFDDDPKVGQSIKAIAARGDGSYLIPTLQSDPDQGDHGTLTIQLKPE